MPDASKITQFLAFDPLDNPLYRSQTIGTGKIGGKARGLLFAREVLAHRRDPALAQVAIPESYFIATGVFDEFVSANGLQVLAESGRDYSEIEAAFERGAFAPWFREALAALLEKLPCPLAVRSSSQLEDNLKYSFAGKYLTTFVSGSGDPESRLLALEAAIKRVYASVYSPSAAEYRRKHGLRGDKMAVLIQRLIGKERGGYFYPETAGVGFSKNYRRWTERIKKEDGVVRLVFGLGTRCVGREYARTFSLTNLNLRPEGHNPREIAKYSQERFDSVDLATGQVQVFNINHRLSALDYHPGFHQYAQVYLAGSNEIRDLGAFLPNLGPGDKIVFTFRNFPRYHPELFSVMHALFATLEEEMGVPVDIEFTYEAEDKVFTLVQVRPLSSYEEYRSVHIPPHLPADHVLLKGDRMLTNGTLLGVKHLVYVDPYIYQEAPDKYAVAREVGRVNRRLEGERYILVGPGRWGSTSPELGVPVNYSEISNTGLLVELGIRQANFVPELSYGTHFFADLEVDGILYLPVFDTIATNVFNAAWFQNHPAEPTGHPAVRVYSGLFDVYLDGEGLCGCVALSR
ncbi:PEP/pyruvate-binding domain-containing protein [Gelria sp. Kuro-4]|uniref:PEP/pyruvate-binding domain-containing protein n=1 Tax=Gelria sp. Kuro-4 TaxID=2796927 RepID=UPI001BED5ED2|nr:PEP/pyruvate-binding domain-containing protein [Gelria sp. Kuro-4]BCV24670.1 pyruvate, phosphate dikinase [Gelria sp. Kuro-4]